VGHVSCPDASLNFRPTLWMNGNGNHAYIIGNSGCRITGVRDTVKKRYSAVPRTPRSCWLKRRGERLWTPLPPRLLSVSGSSSDRIAPGRSVESVVSNHLAKISESLRRYGELFLKAASTPCPLSRRGRAGRIVTVAGERQPTRDPIQVEGERILRENPDLRARLEEYRRKRKAGEPLNLVEHEEVRRRLTELGVSLDGD
jgi:hypothetical protein